MPQQKGDKGTNPQFKVIDNLVDGELLIFLKITPKELTLTNTFE